MREKTPERSGFGGLQAEVMNLTNEFRTRDDELFPRVRDLLQLRGVDPQTTLLVQLHPEDVQAFLGIVVTSTRRVFLFFYDYLRSTIDRGEFREWIELTGLTTHVEYRAFVDQIECGLALAPPTRK